VYILLTFIVFFFFKIARATATRWAMVPLLFMNALVYLVMVVLAAMVYIFNGQLKYYLLIVSFQNVLRTRTNPLMEAIIAQVFQTCRRIMSCFFIINEYFRLSR
jgi:hypothetical protein